MYADCKPGTGSAVRAERFLKSTGAQAPGGSQRSGCAVCEPGPVVDLIKKVEPTPRGPRHLSGRLTHQDSRRSGSARPKPPITTGTASCLADAPVHSVLRASAGSGLASAPPRDHGARSGAQAATQGRTYPGSV